METLGEGDYKRAHITFPNELQCGVCSKQIKSFTDHEQKNC